MNEIDRYVADLRRRLDRLDGGRDITDEAEDHLRATADTLERGGVPRAEAERRAVTEYGDSRIVARGFRRASRQHGAIATTFTRVGGIACMALAFFFIAGLLLNQGPRTDEPAHSLGVAAEVVVYPTLLIGVAALVRRHGGLGRLGWVLVGVLAASPLLILPLGYYGLALALVSYAVAFGLLGLTLYRAAILPRPALLLAFSAPIVYVVAALVVTMADGDMSNGFYIPVLVVLAAFVWFGWAMWNEEPLHRSPSRPTAGLT